MADLSVGGTYEAWRDELINAVIMGASSSMHSFMRKMGITSREQDFDLDDRINSRISSSVVSSNEDRG